MNNTTKISYKSYVNNASIHVLSRFIAILEHLNDVQNNEIRIVEVPRMLKIRWLMRQIDYNSNFTNTRRKREIIIIEIIEIIELIDSMVQDILEQCMNHDQN